MELPLAEMRNTTETNFGVVGRRLFLTHSIFFKELFANSLLRVKNNELVSTKIEKKSLINFKRTILKKSQESLGNLYSNHLKLRYLGSNPGTAIYHMVLP